MNMYIEAVASNRDSSYITLPPSRSRVTGAASFMVERKYGREMIEQEFQRSATNITYEVNLTANPLVNIEVVLDDLTGDVIRGRGTGNLRLRAGTQEPLSLRGRYDIQEGSYLFTFQSFFKKPFVLRSGANNYIEWTGDPYTANIRFEAVYRAENVNFAPLASSLSLDNNRVSNYRGDVNVVAILTGELFKPTFTFKLEFPENSIANSDPSLSFGIQQIENNPNEINKQVTYLIVFNSFAPYQSSITSSLNEFAYSTISGLFFGEVNKRLNQLLSKVLRNDEVTFNFTGSVYNRNLIDRNARGFNINQTDLNFSVGLPLLNDRVQITFGGTFDVPLESDIYIEWTGDPYTANIRFEAVYRAENVNFAPLASSLSLDNNRVSNYRGDVNVVAILTGELFKPTFTFKLEFPENSIANSDPSLSFGIQQIENNPNEINKQVTYLIVFNSFAPYQSSITSSLNEFAYSTISGLFFGEVNKRLNQLLSKVLRNDEVTFNFTGSVYNRNLIDRNARGFNINQTDLNFSVGLPLLNDRVQITFGGTFDVPLESDIEQSIRLFPDVNISLLINKSGSVRATFFYTQTSDPLIGGPNLNTLRNQRAGVKLSYRKEFESLSTIFGRKKGKKKKETPPVDSPRSDSTITSQ
jgi:hypothetical protein